MKTPFVFRLLQSQVSILFVCLCTAVASISCTARPETAGPIQIQQHKFFIRQPTTATKVALLAYPVFQGSGNPEKIKQINFHIGPEGVLGKNVQSLSKDFAEGAIPFEQATAEVVYFGKGLLQVLWHITSTGTYTTTSRITVIADLEKGITHGPESMFNDDLTVARFVDQRIQPVIEKKLQELFQEHPDTQEILIAMGIPLPYGPDDLFNLQLSTEGIYFIYDFKFPQSFVSIEPEPISLFVPWQEIKPFLYEGCILHRFYETPTESQGSESPK